MSREIFTRVKGRSPAYLALIGGLGLLVLLGLASAWTMEHQGHVITGMSNRIVWGVPHVFAVFLIVAASGALNVASISSVFGRKAYKPLARLSVVVAIALLIGGLTVLVLDLGRPDRLIVAVTTYNFRSIFAWNIYLYVGFIAIAGVYLWLMMERSKNQYAKTAGLMAFVWRLALTTGTGSIFGFLVARQAYDAAVMAPLFIAMSFAFGLAIFLLIVMVSAAGTGRELGDGNVRRMKNLLGVFVAAVLYFTVVQHLTNLYAPEHHAVERFILLDGGIYTSLFWGGQIVVGGLLPLILIYTPLFSESRQAIVLAALSVIAGGLSQLYVIIIGGQAFPLILFPGKTVQSSFADGVVASYSPSLPEIGLGIGGIAMALVIVAMAVKILALLPQSLADAETDAT
jgi:Ni/Fe-hydrogenase subunit HybB-like protein